MYKAKSKMTLLKRRGSVLLQTLVMCIILSYIAVTLTQWVLSRFTSSTKLQNDTAGVNMLNSMQDLIYSCGAVAGEKGHITCNESFTASSGTDPMSGVYTNSYGSYTVGSGANLTNSYTFTATIN